VKLFEIAEQSDKCKVMVECYHPVPRLLVLGGGHIAKPLVTIASLLEFEITVIDDRPSYANSLRFPEAKVVICADFITALRDQSIDPYTAVVIITRGHKHDVDCLEHVLGQEPGCIGMIGSHKRVKLVKEYLIDAGYPQEKVERVFMPIGVAIGAQTPEEIAVSIAAQLIEFRRRKNQRELPPTSTKKQWELLTTIMEHLEHQIPLVVATIIRTTGSTPRKVGARMLISRDGSCLGTIGGGCGESAVRYEALMLYDSGGSSLYRVVMNADIMADEGMACGGEMDVFLERVV
jgi:xanthine dehydrogenase accessory factor